MKNQKIIFGFIVLSITLIFGFASCQQDEFNESDSESYLKLSPNVDFSNLSKGDLEILSQAFFRLDIKENEDGLLEIKQKNGKEKNISKELFDYIHLSIESSNKRILADITFIRNSIITREESVNTNSSCVAYSIAYATGQQFNDVNSWITDNYGGNGVPSHEFYSVMNHFFDDGAQVPFTMFNDMDINGSDDNKYIIVINATHAVNVVAKSGSDIVYYDAQNNIHGICSTYNVTHIYEIR